MQSFELRFLKTTLLRVSRDSPCNAQWVSWPREGHLYVGPVQSLTRGAGRRMKPISESNDLKIAKYKFKLTIETQFFIA